MADFRCIPIDTDIAARFRHSGKDDRGETVHRRVAEQGGSPCRHCLRPAEPGDIMLLASYDLPLPRGVYWTPSPIWVHERECTRFSGDNEIAPTVRRSLVSLRSYDADGMCLYDLGHVCEGAEADAPLMQALQDPRTSYVNIHTAKPGCWLCRVERV